MMNPGSVCSSIRALTLVLVTLTSVCAASSLSRRSADDQASDVAVPADASPEVIYEARHKIWAARVTDVIENKMSTVCSTIIMSAPSTGGPEQACDKVLAHKKILGFACSDADLDMFEEVVCNFDTIVVSTLPPATKPTLSSSSSSDSSSSASSSTSTGKTTTAAATTQPKESPSTEEETTATKTGITNKIPVTSPQTPSVARNKDQDGETTHSGKENSTSTVAQPSGSSSSGKMGGETSPSQNEHLGSSPPTYDSRLSEACNKHLASLAHSLKHGGNQSKTSCHKLHLLAGDEVSSHGELPLEKAFLESCTSEERVLLHGLLCTGPGDEEPRHALQGQQQERVKYVIETELTSSCRQALSPLGKSRVKEDVEDTCLSLRGGEGDSLVTNDVCTRGDMDNLLKAVCGSAPGLLRSNWTACVTAALGLVIFWMKAYF